MESLTQIEVLVLAATADRAHYGYELVQRVAELTGGRITVRPGNLYRVLHRLVERGLVRELAATAAEEDERRRYFRATARGRRAAATELTLYASVLRRTPSLREAAADG
ncbi:MAG TPA: helix-turn-helix transcriptional regulator [Longimicrobiales bacterium]|nr:helix-turn-helix transcriptional regulator [Longimicrobiales bacterium]